LPDQLTDLNQIPFKGNLLSATPGHGSLQHPDVLAYRLENQRVGFETEGRARKKMKATTNRPGQFKIWREVQFLSQSRQNPTVESESFKLWDLFQ
jgi:hypothetical protein